MRNPSPSKGTAAYILYCSPCSTFKRNHHPERNEGSPDTMEMSRKARYDGLLCEHSKIFKITRL